MGFLRAKKSSKNPAASDSILISMGLYDHYDSILLSIQKSYHGRIIMRENHDILYTDHYFLWFSMGLLYFSMGFSIGFSMKIPKKSPGSLQRLPGGGHLSEPPTAPASPGGRGDAARHAGRRSRRRSGGAVVKNHRGFCTLRASESSMKITIF